MNDLRHRSWSWFLKFLLLPAGDALFGQQMMKRLALLEEAQWWDMERVEAARDRSLTSLMQVVYREVPFYRDLLDRARVKPEDIRRPADLSRLPIVTKETMRPAYPHLITRKTGSKTYEERTSGSTGQNFCVREDNETAGAYRASFLLALQWAGWKFGERHLQTGITPSRRQGRWLKDAILRCHYVSAYDLTDQALDTGLELLEKYRIEHLWGYPGSLYALARRAGERRWNTAVRSIVTWGDNLYPHYRKTIEAAFRARVFDTYGCCEGMQIAAQCGHHSTYHLHSLDVVAEFLDDAGHPVPAGQPGHLVLTRLHPGPMPLIRYRIGDLGVAGSRNCGCGRSFETMESIAGREADIVTTPSGNRLIVHFFTGVLEHFPEVESFQVIQSEHDAMTVRVVPTGGYSRELGGQIVSALSHRGAAGMKITIEPVKEIPILPSGKRRFVVSELAASAGRNAN